MSEKVLPCSDELRQTPEELHSTSFGGACGFRLTWDAMVAEELTKEQE